MDILGNIYIDYFAYIEKLDGKSHLLNKFNLGGFFNLFEKNFANKFNLENNHFYCISQKESFNNYVKNSFEINFKINHIFNSRKSPQAIIFEYKNTRTSFLLEDNQIQIDSFKNKSKNIIIYYGDKINIKSFEKYPNKIFLDTAGNNIEDLKLLANSYPRDSIISISSEYLSLEIKNRYLDLGFIIISHNPKYVEIIKKNFYQKINNRFFINPDKLNYKITGIGDKFFYLFAENHSEKNLNLKESIIEAQKEIFSYISNI